MEDTQDLDPILTEIGPFLNESGLSATRLGQLAVNDGTFVHELRRGRECRRSTRKKLREFMQRWREQREVAA